MTFEDTFRGANLDEALTSACTELRSRVGELYYDVLPTDGDGQVTIHAEVDPVAVLGLFLSETFRAGELEVTAQLTVGEEALDGELKGGDVRLLTGGGGKGLDALQYLCNRILTRRLPRHAPVHLDTDGFKRRSGNPVVRGPRTPAARRDSHLALADDPGVETTSDGEGFLKRVVIRPRRRH